jgi:hypothetical protein
MRALFAFLLMSGFALAGDDAPVDYPLMSIEEWLQKLSQEPNDAYKVITFRVAKDEIRVALQSAAEKADKAFQAKDDKAALIFEEAAYNELLILKTKYTLSYLVWVDPELNKDKTFLVTSTSVKYEDVSGEISWRFDVVFEPRQPQRFFMTRTEQMEKKDGEH